MECRHRPDAPGAATVPGCQLLQLLVGIDLLALLFHLLARVALGLPEVADGSLLGWAAPLQLVLAAWAWCELARRTAVRSLWWAAVALTLLAVGDVAALPAWLMPSMARLLDALMIGSLAGLGLDKALAGGVVLAGTGLLLLPLYCHPDWIVQRAFRITLLLLGSLGVIGACADLPQATLRPWPFAVLLAELGEELLEALAASIALAASTLVLLAPSPHQSRFETIKLQ